jgi:photosystem II stability/assembly factor-like uncharacterized protein
MQALQFWGAQRAYPGRAIPDEPYGAALDRLREMRAGAFAGLEDQVPPWEPLGPDNVGGRTLSLALHPDDPDVIFAGSASGGLWKSTTGGIGADAWDYVDTGFPVLGVSTIAIDPADPDVMYIGTGEAYDYEESIGGEVIRTTRGSYGVGILKTEDGGATWTSSLDWTYQQSHGVWMIAIHPADTDVLFAATTEGIYKSVDAGASWNLVHAVVMGMDVRIHPANPDIVFASHGSLGSPGVGIYRSTNGGASWTQLAAGLPSSWNGKTQLFITPTAPSTIYASIGNSSAGLGLYKSTDTGDTWFQVNSTNYAQYQGWYSHYVIVSPFDAQTLFTGGIEIWRSTNGGTTLSERSDWQEVFFDVSPPEGPIGGPHYAHADHHFAVWHPTDPDTVFFASDGGVFRTTDLGNTFESLIGGYRTSQFYNGFSNSPTDPGFAMGGLQDNFTVIYEGTNAWRRAIGGDGSWTAIHPTLPATIYGSAQYLYLVRSYDAGGDWTFIEPPEMPGDLTAFVAPYVLAASQPSVLYAGRSRVYRSGNEGNNWTATNHGTQLSPGNPLLSLAVAPTDANTVYAGTAPIAGPARVFRTSNGGNTWSDVTGTLPDRYPSDIAVHPTQPLTAWVTFMGFGTPHLFKTVNGGVSWADVGSGLPDVPTSAVQVDPDHPEIVYVGTDLGIFFSDDDGASWQPFGNGMPPAMVNDLKVFLPSRKLRAATHGSGVWERDLFDPNICPDADLDGACDGDDCAPEDSEAWQLPGEAGALLLSHTGGPAGTTSLAWSAAEPGAETVVYDTVSSLAAHDFALDASVTCVETDDGADTEAQDAGAPAPGAVLFYLVRAQNACGHGPAGTDSSGQPRVVAGCP